MTLYKEKSKQIFVTIGLALVCMLGAASGPLRARVCQGNPGELTQIPLGDMPGIITALESYECVVDGQLQCFVVGYDSNSEVLRVRHVESDGSLAVVQDIASDLTNVRSIAFFKCSGECYVVLGSFELNENHIYHVNSTTGVLDDTGLNLNGELILDITAFVCNGVCYIATAGISPSDSNRLYTFDPAGPSISAGIQYDTLNDLDSITSFECDGKWWVVTLGRNNTEGNNLYVLDPCTGALELSQGEFAINDSPLNSLTVYSCNNRCYVVALLVGTNTEVFELDPVQGSLISVEATLNTDQARTVTSLSCGCRCYVIFGGNGADGNLVFEVENDGDLLIVQNPFSDFEFDVLIAYECCGRCYVLGGSTTNQAELFEMHNPKVEANNDCFGIMVGESSVLDIFANDCGCFEENTAIFYRDEDLTDLIGGPTDFTDVSLGAGRGSLSWVQNYGTLTYTASAVPVTDCFFYTVDDCCECHDCAKVTVNVAENTDCCEWTLAILQN